MSPNGYIHIANPRERSHFIAAQSIAFVALALVIVALAALVPINGVWLAGVAWPLPLLGSQAAGQAYRKRLQRKYGAKYVAVTNAEGWL